MRLRAAAIVWIAVISLTGIAGQWLGYPVESLWRWLLGLFLVALLIEYVTMQSTALAAHLTPKGTAYLGRNSQWHLGLVNQSRRRLSLRVAPLSPKLFTGAVPERTQIVAPREEVCLDFVQMPQQLGEHLWPPQPVELDGFFRLASWLRCLPLHTRSPEGDAPAATFVEPDQLHPAGRRAALDQLGPRAAPQIAQGGQEFHSLRTYTPGDSPASIDWKSTARSGQLRVRETQAEQQLLVYFVLDCGRGSSLQLGDMSVLGHSANLIARLAEFANSAGDRCGLLTFADQPLAQLRPGRGNTHLRFIRNTLTRVTSIDAESNPLSAVVTLANMLPQRALILLFTSLDDSEAAGQLAQATLLLRPQHLPMLVSIEDPWVRDTAQGLNLDAQDPYVAIAAQEQRRSAAKTRAQVERLGAMVIEAQPQHIETLVFERLRRLRGRYSV